MKHIARDLTPPIVWRLLSKAKSGLAQRMAIRAEAKHQARTVRGYFESLKNAGVNLSGATVLELGPGPTPGAALILASRGAKVLVTEIDRITWNAEYHPAVLRQLTRIFGHLPAVDASLARHDFALEQPASLRDIPSSSIDIVLSIAVLEHVGELPETMRQLHRISRPNAVHIHQVDFRDHRHFDTPLEFLLDEEPLASTTGSRRRCSEYIAVFKAADFAVSCTPNLFASAEYLREFVPRLRACGTAYSSWPETELRDVSALFVLHKSVERKNFSLAARRGAVAADVG